MQNAPIWYKDWATDPSQGLCESLSFQKKNIISYDNIYNNFAGLYCNPEWEQYLFTLTKADTAPQNLHLKSVRDVV